ncbi:MAG: alkaline phosphatase family protein [Anaerolineales bacterium]|nr:alkaline phosphatase family protein [Anaerolineales bacterium]
MPARLPRAPRAPFALTLLLLLPLAGLPARSATPARAARAPHVLLFTADGAQPDLLRQFAAQGYLPTFARLAAAGAVAPGGMAPQLPTSTRVGWPALLTGAWGGTHGAVNNVFTRHGLGMAESFPAGSYSPLEAETLPEAAARAGLKVLIFDWNSSDQPPQDVPTVDYWRTYTPAGVAQNYAEPRVEAGAAAWGLLFQRLSLSPLTAGPGAPPTFSPLVGSRLRLTAFTGAFYDYALRFYDATDDGRRNYDRVVVAAERGQLADLAVNEWAEIRLRLLGGVDDGRTAGFYVKLLALAPDLSRVKLFVSAITRVTAQPAALEDYLADHFPTRLGVGGPLAWEGLIDEATYAEAAALTIDFDTQALPWLLGEYAPDTNLALVGYLNTDIIQHAMLALVTPGAPVYDDADRDGRPDGLVAQRLGYLRDTYVGADRILAAAWGAMPPDTVVAATSDHGFAATWKAVYAPYVLQQAGLQPVPQTANCSASDAVLAKACWVGGAVMIYLNVAGREPHGVVSPSESTAVRERVMAAWRDLTDIDGTPITAAVFTAEQAAALPSGWALAGMAHPDKTGDVIVFVNPPYQFDFAEGGAPVRDTSVWWAAHGHLPQSGAGRANTNLHAAFYLGGPGLRPLAATRVRTIDVAPTLAYLLGLPPLAQAQGRVLSEALAYTPCPLFGQVTCAVKRR